MNIKFIIYFIIYFILINILSFVIMWYDKKKAQKSEWRVSEKALFLFALFLGGIGIYSGMYKFRHKTKHLKFTVGIPIVIILNGITIYYIFTKFYYLFNI